MASKMEDKDHNMIMSIKGKEIHANNHKAKKVDKTFGGFIVEKYPAGSFNPRKDNVGINANYNNGKRY